MISNTILLVQSGTDLAPHFRGRLEDRGYTVVEAVNAAAAMDIVNASEIALVVTDLYLRVGKFRCLAHAIGKSPALHRTKLLAYTEHGKREDRVWAQQTGADGYVLTRSGEDRFLSVVDQLMTARWAPRRSGRRLP